MSKRSKSSSTEVSAHEVIATAPEVVAEASPVSTEAARAEAAAVTPEVTRKPTKLNAEAGAEFPYGAGNGFSVAELQPTASSNVAPSFNTTLEDYNKAHRRELNAAGNGGVRAHKPMTLPRAGGFGGVTVNTATGEYTVTGDGVFDPSSNAGENHDFAGELAALNAQASALLRDLYTPIAHKTDACVLRLMMIRVSKAT